MSKIPPTLNHPLAMYSWTDNFIWLDDTTSDLNTLGWVSLQVDDSLTIRPPRLPLPARLAALGVNLSTVFIEEWELDDSGEIIGDYSNDWTKDLVSLPLEGFDEVYEVWNEVVDWGHGRNEGIEELYTLSFDFPATETESARIRRVTLFAKDWNLNVLPTWRIDSKPMFWKAARLNRDEFRLSHFAFEGDANFSPIFSATSVEGTWTAKLLSTGWKIDDYPYNNHGGLLAIFEKKMMMNEAKESLRQLGIMDLTLAEANLAWENRRGFKQ
jgi:hypothetical protein